MGITAVVLLDVQGHEHAPTLLAVFPRERHAKKTLSNTSHGGGGHGDGSPRSYTFNMKVRNQSFAFVKRTGISLGFLYEQT